VEPALSLSHALEENCRFSESTIIVHRSRRGSILRG
jgi:hypothetical protein